VSGVFETALKSVARVHVDDRDQIKPGAKFFHWEQKGVPVRLNIGPRDVAADVVELARRDTLEKTKNVAVASLVTIVADLLLAIQKNMFDTAVKFRQDNTVRVDSYDELKQALAQKNVFVEVFWAGTSDDEARIKAETKATVRCIPFQQDGAEGKCMLTGKPTPTKVVFARSY
jgi:prolyl-tRNA synthetase